MQSIHFYLYDYISKFLHICTIIYKNPFLIVLRLLHYFADRQIADEFHDGLSS